ncbi:MAG: ATP-binding protein [Spirochaetaceae bacterium]|jgi:predicted AAA+ superfamily ATPase|nr:ATP-binding protein [Spirochaetaceae bacterium]
MNNRYSAEYARCCGLTVFRHIRNDPLFSVFEKLLGFLSGAGSPEAGKILSCAGEFLFLLAGRSPILDWGRAVEDMVLGDENPYTRAVEATAGEPAGSSIPRPEIPGALTALAEHDLESLRILAALHPGKIIETLEEMCGDAAVGLPAGLFHADTVADPEERLSQKKLLSRWKEGAGIFSGADSFVWENGRLLPVLTPDPITLEQLIGYETQREVVLENTRRFAAGFRANNLLLYGDRGTGKSATIKAAARAAAFLRVKIIEVRKQQLTEFPQIIDFLRDRNFRFIIFIDDLSFDRADESYVGLKALLEGGLETRPENVLLYATSNRRHLVKERVQDRIGLGSVDAETEIRAQDSLQEQLSLADRFGMTVIFSAPLQDEYLRIVSGMIEKRGLKADREKALADALRWEKWYNGRSPRTARQFVDWLEGGEAAPWDRMD